MVDTKKLKVRMIQKDTNIQLLAPKTGYTPYTLGQMISNKSKMTICVSEILIKELEIPKDEITDFFYI
jgi:hypothetical protein